MSKPIKRKKKNLHLINNYNKNQGSLFDQSSNVSGLRQPSELGHHYDSCFPFQYFNRMQSECFEVIMNTNHNLVVNAPTGSGKTVIFELAIVKALSIYNKFYAVYIAPTKALCSEKINDWKMKFTKLGINCYEFTGDIYEDLDMRSDYGLIISTPEKWDSVSRKNRTKIMKYNPRTIVVSATIPNLNSIANWLSYYIPNSEARLTSVKAFGDEYRPVPLIKEVLGYPKNSKNDFIFDKNLDYKLPDVIKKYSDGEPSLIFCSTRKSALNAAEYLSKSYFKFNQRNSSLGYIINKIHDKKLKGKATLFKKHYNNMLELISNGVAFHHAGLSYEDRKIVENLFIEKSIDALCATSTLSVGVNLPAHLVIIKSTKGYINSQFNEYSAIDILQMVGRAGRPQYDSFGVAVIMTELTNVEDYNVFLEGSKCIESRLHENLIEHLNAEFCLGKIQTESDAIEWLKTTFLYVRIQENTAYYKLEDQNHDIPPNKKLESINLFIVHISTNNIVILTKYLNKLKENNLIELNKAGTLLCPTEIGFTMSNNYLRFQTILNIRYMLNYSSIQHLLEILSLSEEFNEYRFSQGEKKHLNERIKNPAIKYKISNEKPPKVKTINQKVNLIIQCTIGNVSLINYKVNPNLVSEINSILFSSKRICKGLKYATSLHAIGIKNLSDLSSTTPERIELKLNRNPPFGKQLIETAKQVPKFNLQVTKIEEYPKTLKTKLMIIPEIINSEKAKEKKGNYFINTHIIVSSGKRLIYHIKESIKRLKNNKAIQLTIEPQYENEIICIELLYEDYDGIDIENKITLDSSIQEIVSNNDGSLDEFLLNKENENLKHEVTRSNQVIKDEEVVKYNEATKEKEIVKNNEVKKDTKINSYLSSPNHKQKALKRKTVFLEWLNKN
ncbi:P-loop containing nucleoside triphosphate hydrolase protein [Neoconidiobolus thromboides FSU 785]|nr:P-loop containing nucleoside triphosphate hydrolase protein [Neoconidiobolus thromboides FSU 785]